MSSPLHVVVAGRGPRVVLVHGSAADHATWSIQLASTALRERFELVAYDRRAAGSVEAHADDLAALIERGAPAAPPVGPVVVVGSSFGAVVTLACAWRRPALVRGMVLCEPPLAAPGAASARAAFVAELDAIAARDGGEAAAERFLRAVLGDAAFDRMPRAFQARATAKWDGIRADSVALDAYTMAWDRLGEVRTPALLLGGGRSAPYFRPTLDALAARLPAARLEVLPGAGHMLHAEAPKGFADALARFTADLPP